MAIIEVLSSSATSRPLGRLSAGRLESGGLAPRSAAASRARLPIALALGAGLVLLWLLVNPRTPDLAAQAYRVGLFEQVGFTLFDEHWYAGHGIPGYSLLFAPLASLIGMRALAAASVLVSIALFERLVLDEFGGDLRVRLGACVFAVAAIGDLWSGRLTFALGVTFALACVFALSRQRLLLAALLAGVCAAASPVAGALLTLAALTYALGTRRPRVLIAVALPVALVLVPVELLFGEGGFEPYPARSFAASALVAVVFAAALPRRERLLRLGAVLYLIACLLALAIHTLLGSNIERYAVLLAAPLLLCALGRSRQGAGLARSRPAPAAPAPAVAAAALGVILVWVVWGPVRETLAVSGSQATRAAYYTPVERFLAAHGGALARVEVPLTRSHWEAAFLAPRFSLARGWEKQLEERYDAVLLGHSLSAEAYRAWLHEQAVTYVALPDAQLDPPSASEGTLIRGGLPYLREVFSSAHWRIYAVREATPLLQGPGRLTALGHDRFAFDARAPGTFLIRVHYSRYFAVAAGDGCVARAPRGWTYVRAGSAGRIDVAASFSLSRALGLGGSCPA